MLPRARDWSTARSAFRSEGNPTFVGMTERRNGALCAEVRKARPCEAGKPPYTYELCIFYYKLRNLGTILAKYLMYTVIFTGDGNEIQRRDNGRLLERFEQNPAFDRG